MPNPFEDRNCKTASTTVFFQQVWPNPDHTTLPNIKALKVARKYCDSCPCLSECLALAMDNEGGSAIIVRAGVYGGFTPQQRISLEKRKISHRCGCGSLRDPNQLRAGVVSCANPDCTDRRRIPKLPDRGDEWATRHTTLARKVVARLVSTVEAGDPVPTVAQMANKLDVRRTDMRRVYDALIADESIEWNGDVYVRRQPTGSARKWIPVHLRSPDRPVP